MALDDLILTIDSDAEDIEVDESAPGPSRPASKKSKSKATKDSTTDEKDALNPEFTFDVTGDVYDEVLDKNNVLSDLVKGSKRVRLHVI